MIAKTAEKFGSKNIGIGSDLCQNQPDSIVEWMRNGRWTKTRDFGEGDSSTLAFLFSLIGSNQIKILSILRMD